MTNAPRSHANPADRHEGGLAPILWSDQVNLAAGAALATALRQLERVESGGRPDELAHALTQVGHALVRLKALDAAEAYLEQALHWATLMPGIDVQVDLACRLAEVASARAEFAACTGDDLFAIRHLRERARGRAGETAALAAHVADAKWEASVLLRVADVYETCGDHDAALTLHSRVLALLGLADADPSWRDTEAQVLTVPGWLM